MENIREGLRISCLYALSPYGLSYCRQKDEEKFSLFLDFVKGKETEAEKIRSILLKDFPVFTGYYKMIAEMHGLDLFDKEVARTYWRGSPLLDVFFEKNRFIPFHLCHVLTGDRNFERLGIKSEIFGINQCLIGWGNTKKITDRVLIYGYQLLTETKNGFFLSPPVARNVEWSKDSAPELEIGDNVSLHWGKIIEVLNREELEQLKKYTQRTIEFCNNVLR